MSGNETGSKSFIVDNENVLITGASSGISCEMAKLLCSSGIYCRYFQNAVLPIEKDLYTQILKQNNEEE